MSANAPGSSVILAIPSAMAILAVVFLQSLGKTSVKDDDDLPPSPRRSDRDKTPSFAARVVAHPSLLTAN
jgi:hypothetical protein